MKLKIIHPYGVSYAVVSDEATDEEINEVVRIATMIEEGNGSGRIKFRNQGMELKEV